jgi:type I restriction enzyme S subunit
MRGLRAQSEHALPAGWVEATLGECLAVLRGVSYSKDQSGSEPLDGFIAILRANNIGETLNFDDLVYVKAGCVSDDQMLRVGDIVVAASSGSMKVVGKAAPLLSPWRGAFGAFCYALRVHPALSAQYIAAFLQTEEYRHQASERAKGTNINNLRREHITSVRLRLPPLPEQARIADRIDELFTDLAAGVAALERVKRNLSRYRAAVLHAAVTGRLTEAWRKQHGKPEEPGTKLLERILAERRRQWERRTLAKYEKDGKQPPKNWRDRYPEPLPPKLPADGSPLSVLPEGWCWASVDQVTQIIQYGTSAKTNEDASGVPVLRMGNITTDGTVDYTNLKYLPHDHHEFPELLLERGDVLFNRTNSAELVGKTAVFEPTTDCRYSLASYLIRVRAVAGCSPWWLTWCVISPLGRRWLRSVLSHTAGQANVNGTKLAEYVIPLPPDAEQAAIVEAVNEKLSQIDALEAEVARGLARASRLRQAILKAAFEGKLVPQDPADEPAIALLERMRAAAGLADAPRGGRRTSGSRAMMNGVSS